MRGIDAMRCVPTVSVVSSSCVLAASLLLAACGSSGPVRVDWSSAEVRKVDIEKPLVLEQKGIEVKGGMQRHSQGMTMKLAITSKGPKLRYDAVRAFWDNEEMKIRGLRIGEMRARDLDGGGWRAEIELECKVHKWPDKDVVFLAVGPAIWKLEAEL